MGQPETDLGGRFRRLMEKEMKNTRCWLFWGISQAFS